MTYKSSVERMCEGSCIIIDYYHHGSMNICSSLLFMYVQIALFCHGLEFLASFLFLSPACLCVFPLQSYHSVICMHDDDDARAGEGEERPVEGRNKARERVPRGENQSVTRREREGRGKRTG